VEPSTPRERGTPGTSKLGRGHAREEKWVVRQTVSIRERLPVVTLQSRNVTDAKKKTQLARGKQWGTRLLKEKIKKEITDGQKRWGEPVGSKTPAPCWTCPGAGKGGTSGQEEFVA